MKYLICLFFLFVSFISMSQTYIAIEPSISNIPGTFGCKSNFSIEAGRQWDVFSLGLGVGKTTLSSGRQDTCTYFEFRPNLNIFQVGKFTNTFTSGIGYVFKAKNNFLTELTYGIEYSYTERLHLNIMFGQYYYSGLTTASTETFFGISIMYFFKPYRPSSLIKQPN